MDDQFEVLELFGRAGDAYRSSGTVDDSVLLAPGVVRVVGKIKVGQGQGPPTFPLSLDQLFERVRRGLVVAQTTPGWQEEERHREYARGAQIKQCSCCRCFHEQ